MVATVKERQASKVLSRIKSAREKLEAIADRVQARTAMLLRLEADSLDRVAEEIRSLSELPADAFVPNPPAGSLARIEELEWMLEDALKGRIPSITARIIADQREEIERLRSQLRQRG